MFWWIRQRKSWGNQKCQSEAAYGRTTFWGVWSSDLEHSGAPKPWSEWFRVNDWCFAGALTATCCYILLQCEFTVSSLWAPGLWFAPRCFIALLQIRSRGSTQGELIRRSAKPEPQLVIVGHSWFKLVKKSRSEYSNLVLDGFNSYGKSDMGNVCWKRMQRFSQEHLVRAISNHDPFHRNKELRSWICKYHARIYTTILSRRN